MGPEPFSTRDTREWRRMQAWHLKRLGWKQRDIAVALGVSAGAVSQGFAAARAAGPAALRSRPPPRPPRQAHGRTTAPAARFPLARPGGVWLSRGGVDLRPGRTRPEGGVRRLVQQEPGVAPPEG